jgi:hypothetical protein
MNGYEQLKTVAAVLEVGLGNQPEEEDRDPVSGDHEDQGAGRRGASSQG